MLTPREALQLAERMTMAAIMRQAALLPARHSRRAARMSFAGEENIR